MILVIKKVLKKKCLGAMSRSIARIKVLYFVSY